jgi:hypothetical protein
VCALSKLEFAGLLVLFLYRRAKIWIALQSNLSPLSDQAIYCQGSRPLVEAEYQLEAVCADATVATALGIDLGSAIFRIAHSAATSPIRVERLPVGMMLMYGGGSRPIN